MRAITRISPRLWVFLSCCFAPAAASEFIAPAKIKSESGTIRGAAITLDTAGNPFVVFSAGDRVYLSYGLDGFQTTRLITNEQGSAVLQDSPAIDTDTLGVSYIAFTEQNGGSVHDIKWTHNPGGQFMPAALVPGSGHEDVVRPHIEIGTDGTVFIGWSTNAGTGEGHVYISLGGGPAQEILTGSDASFGLDGNGTIHVAYVRAGDLYYSNNDGGDFNENEVAVTNAEAAVSLPEIAVNADGTPFVTYWTDDAGRMRLYATGGNWQDHQLITDSAFFPCSAVCVRGSMYIVAYVQNGQIWRFGGRLGLAGQSERILSLTGGVRFVDFDIDKSMYMHVIYVQWGELYYANNAPLPKAAFTADPTAGEWPLEVTFMSTSTGHIVQYLWDFGDGERSLLKNAVHFYTEEGTYTVKLKVLGASGAQDEVIKEDLIVVGPKRNHLRIPDVAVYAGQRAVHIPIRATNDQPIQGFQIAARYEKEKIALWPSDSFVSLTATTSLAVDPEFVAPQQYPEQGYFTLGSIFDVIPPITGKMIMPGTERNILNLVVDIYSGLPNRDTTWIRLENDLGSPPISNIFTIRGGYSVYPVLHNGVITVYRPEVENPGPTFLRGDANNDVSIGIADGVYTLSYLFAEGPAPYCMDAADFDDDGTVTIGDAIATLSYLFRGTFFPQFPFPLRGLDPTPDDLPACGEP